MADRIVKPDSGNDLVLQNDDGSAKIQINEDGTINFTSGTVISIDDLNTDVISVDDAAVGLNIDFSAGNNTTSKITLKDNVDDALNITEGSNSYIKFVTTDSNEQIVFGKNSTFSGTTVDVSSGTFTTSSAQKQAIVDGATNFDVSGGTFTTSSAQKEAIVQAGPGSGTLDVSSGTFTTSSAQKQAIIDGASANQAGVKTALNASGSAPIFTCRAWVNFNGTGTVAINGSGNVSSITDVGTGHYAANFTTAMPDANYSLQAGILGVGGSGQPHFGTPFTTATTSSAGMIAFAPSFSATDAANCYITIHR